MSRWGKAHVAAIASRGDEILAAKRALDRQNTQPDDLSAGQYRVAKIGRWRVARWQPSQNRWIEPGGNARPAGYFDEIGERVA